MNEGVRIKDRFGLPLSTHSQVAVDHWQEGVDRMLSQDYAPEEKLQQALDIDEGFALAHGCQAYVGMIRGDAAQAKASSDRARELAPGVSDREKQAIEAVGLWVDGKGPQSLALIREHLKEYPRDGLMSRLAQRLFMLGCSGAGVPRFPGELFDLCASIAPHCMDDWSFLSQYSFAHHETGRLDEALKLAQRSLDMRPTNAVASHSVTHVYFEKGDASSGDDFLGNWITCFDKRAPYHVHLSWHLALFRLALGHYQDAVGLYESDIRPSVVAKSPTSLSDSASLMWRLQLYGKARPPMPWEEVRDQAAPAADRNGPAFRDAHAALAFGACGDDAAMSQLVDRLGKLADQGNALAAEVTLPLVQGISAFAQENYSESVRLLEPQMMQLERIGGSHAQREVFEDTMLEAYLRAEQFDKAQDMLDERLSRRASVRDTFWLGRSQSAVGNAEAAKSAISDVLARWQDVDRASPEISNVTELANVLS